MTGKAFHGFQEQDNEGNRSLKDDQIKDYTRWRQEYFDQIPADQLHAEAVAYAKAHPYQGNAKEIITNDGKVEIQLDDK